MPEFLTVTETAVLLRYSRRTVLRLIDDGEIPARKVGRQWRIARQAVLDRLTPTAPTPEATR